MKRSVAFVACVVFPVLASAAETTVTVNHVDGKGVGATAGTVRIVETPYGLAFYPDLKGLPPGLHGFHVHQNASCAPADKDGAAVAALAAGGHFDPQDSKRHGEPWGDGHLGDLPGLYVAADGSAGSPVLAPRLKLSDVAKRALMVHAGGDNHSDNPAPLGGGGARIACGVIGS
ncbi:MAG: superoxide dismutase family protein [Candidatus Accumulibacter sp.]|uniref:superoxide dismutase [Cu-Zn] SodC n=1 Tax=Accumulibacter sp. TaxID=2053492 RepID=UPI0025F25521|nr:superoxide dismutase [Cu-Zn] SodC [Accumulibacter sp.]MCP5249617.1 superoxide dismutase family protein [Accumulibacter sp.]